jgi:Cu+-exporting ATPase
MADNDDVTLDPVCGMEVDTAAAHWHSLYQGFEYFFCSAGCKERFDDDPDRFTATAENEEESLPYY